MGSNPTLSAISLAEIGCIVCGGANVLSPGIRTHGIRQFGFEPRRAKRAETGAANPTLSAISLAEIGCIVSGGANVLSPGIGVANPTLSAIFPTLPVAMKNLGFFGVIHLILVVYAGLRILDSRDDTARKIVWLIVVALFPVIGLIAWYLIGPGSPRHS